MNKCNPTPAFIVVASTIIIIGMFVLIGGLIFDSVKADRKFKTEDKIAELSTKVYLLEKKVSLLVNEQEMLHRQLKAYDEERSGTGCEPEYVHHAPTSIQQPRKTDVPEGMVKCPKCNGKGCAVVNIGGAQLNLVQDKCLDCDGRGYAFKNEKPETSSR